MYGFIQYIHSNMVLILRAVSIQIQHWGGVVSLPPVPSPLSPVNSFVTLSTCAAWLHSCFEWPYQFCQYHLLLWQSGCMVCCWNGSMHKIPLSLLNSIHCSRFRILLAQAFFEITCLHTCVLKPSKETCVNVPSVDCLSSHALEHVLSLHPWMETQWQTNGNAITVGGQKPTFNNSIDKDLII